MKKLADVNNRIGFFSQYREIMLDNFTAIFGELENEQVRDLDFILSDNFGQRILTTNLAEILVNESAEDCMNRIIKSCNAFYFEQWKELKNSMLKALKTDVDKPLTDVHTMDESRVGSSTDNTQNKANAYDNVVTASDTDSTEVESEHSDSIERNELIQRSNGKTAAENAAKVISFVKNYDFLKMVCSDIADFATVKIYAWQ